LIEIVTHEHMRLAKTTLPNTIDGKAFTSQTLQSATTNPISLISKDLARLGTSQKEARELMSELTGLTIEQLSN
jgi:hypothetical protein